MRNYLLKRRFAHVVWIGLTFVAATAVRASSPDTQLIEAAKKMDVADMADAIAAGANVNCRHGMQTPLAMLSDISDERFLPAFKLLLQHGVDVNGGNGAMLLQVCGSPYGDAVLPEILRAKPNLNVSNQSGDGVIAVAVQNGNLGLISPLLAAGAPADEPNEKGETALMLIAGYEREAFREQEYVAVAGVLLNSGSDPKRLDAAGRNAADHAFAAGNFALLRLLDSTHRYADRYDELRHIDLNRQLADIILRHAWGQMHWAGRGPKLTPVDTLATAKQLLKDGADPNARAKTAGYDTTMLGLALGDLRNGPLASPDSKLVSLLLKNGADANLRFPDGDLPLSVAMRDTDVALLLLKNGADPRGVSEVKIRASGWQARLRDPRAIKELAPQTMLHTAAAIGSAEIVKQLLAKGADRDAVDADGYTPLLRAATSGNNEAALALIAAGADSAKKDPSGKTAADIAADHRNISLLRQLDRDGSHAALLTEFKPTVNDPIIGTWVCDLPRGIQLTLDADGGGRTTLTGGSPVAWKRSDWSYVIVVFGEANQLMGLPSLVEMPATYDVAAAVLSVTSMGTPGQTLHFYRVGHLPPATSTVAQSSQFPDVSKALADSRAGGGTYITLLTPGLTTIPKEIYDLPGLRNLQMTGTQVRSLPAELGQMRLLDSIRVANCRLEEIAPEVCALPALKILDMTFNRLHAIPAVLAANPAIEQLALDNNFLSKLPSDWSRAAALASLSVTENRLRDLPGGLVQAPALKNLAAGDNLLSDLPNEWQGWQLRSLQLSRNRFSAVPQVLPSMTALEFLDLRGNELHEIGTALSHLPKLRRLDLSGNQLSEVPDLRDSSIEELNLSANQIRSLGEGPERLPRGLRELSLWGNQLTDVPEWLLALPLRQLNVSNNPIPPARMAEIMRRVQASQQARFQELLKPKPR
jgi:ankyrin repeat protein